MATYAVILTGGNEGVAERIEKKFPHGYEMVEKTVFLLRSEDISEKVAVSIGLKGDDRIEDATGVVLRLNGAFAGYASTSLWEWLVQEEG